MFPSVGKEDIKEKIKEKNWDDRFVKGGIPEYSPLRDKHVKSYRKPMGKSDGRTEEGGPKAEDVAKGGRRTYFEKRMELMDELATLHR
jgi:hypothetical protein